MRLNRTSIALGLAAGALIGGGAGALAASGGSSSSSSSSSTTTTAPYAPSHGGHGLHWTAAHGVMFQAAASYLGLSQTALQTQLDNGKTLAQVANPRGKSVSGLENAMSTAYTNSVNADATLTASQKTALLANLKNRVDALVNSTGSYAYSGGHKFFHGLH